MSIIYDFLLLILTIIYLPKYLFKHKFHKGFSRRLGRLPGDLRVERPLWIHAVSVGEAMAVRGLVDELRKAYPAKKIVISTVTPTGNKIAQGIAKEGDLVTYLPLDFSFIVKKVINKINPCLFIIAETEIWPNLITQLFSKRIPIITVNGRISDSSFRGYSLMKFLISPILRKIELFCVQTRRDTERLVHLGVALEKIQVAGNMKFDIADFKDQTNETSQYRKKLNLQSDEKLLVCGSTHPGEEEIILKAYREIISEFPILKLLIAPRHPERSVEVEKIVARFGLGGMRISKMTPESFKGFTQPVYILDTIGQLVQFYSASDIVFVGGSLIKKGGHNILEPASLGKPILFGPHMFNFKDIAELFLEDKAAILVRNQQELKNAVRLLIIDASRAQELGLKAKDLVLKNTGSTKNTLCFIKKIFKND